MVFVFQYSSQIKLALAQSRRKENSSDLGLINVNDLAFFAALRLCAKIGF
jgi:hypothetical protein